jgi:hypothetical protein
MTPRPEPTLGWAAEQIDGYWSGAAGSRVPDRAGPITLSPCAAGVPLNRRFWYRLRDRSAHRSVQIVERRKHQLDPDAERCFSTRPRRVRTLSWGVVRCA